MPAFSLSRNYIGILVFSCFAIISKLSATPTVLPAALPEDLFPELKTLLVTASEQSPNLVASNLSVVQSEANVYIAAGPQWPSLSSYANYGVTSTSISNVANSASRTTGLTYQIYVSQPIYYWGTLKAQTDIAKLQRDVAEKNYAEAYRGLAQTIRSQYLGLIQKKVGVRNVRYTEHLAETNVDLLQKKLDDGRISPGDLNMPRLELDEAKVATEKALFDYEFSRKALAHLAGVKEITDESVPETIPRPAYTPETLAAYFEGEKNNDYRNTNLGRVYADSVRQAELTYKIAKYRLYPKFGFSANTLQQNSSYLNGGGAQNYTTTSSNVGISANWTIFDGFATRGAKLSALAAKRLAAQNLKDFVDTTGTRVAQLEKLIGFAGRAMAFAERRKDLADSGVQRVKEDAAEGVTSVSTIEAFTDGAYKAESVALGARADFLSLWSEYVSLTGDDPVLNNIQQKDLRHVR